jgi:hypothetical protein
MIKNFFQSRWGKITLVALVLTIFIGSFYLITSVRKISLIRTEPNNNQEEVPLNSPISFIFNQEISEETVSDIETTPVFPYQIEISGQKLIINPDEALEPNQTYSIKISYHNQQQNLIFTTIRVDPLVEKARIGNPEIAQEMSQYQEENYPLFAVTPKKTPNWTINYSAPLELTISYNKGIDISLVQEEVIAWITSFGLSQDSHQYIWKAI